MITLGNRWFSRIKRAPMFIEDYKTKYTMGEQEVAKTKDVLVISNLSHPTSAYLILQP